ncbi:hypothetical protein [Streptomyces sp. NPDC058664]|uniref:hypothetical protein n=1 Tax=unclassified Streptomyces TaxID=2593676 RepID=UPI00364FDEC9
MTDDKQRRENLAKGVITAYLTRQMDAANEKAMDAAGTAEAHAEDDAARQARDRLQR